MMRDRNVKRYDNGLILGLSAGGVAFVLIQLLHIIHGVQRIRDIENEQGFKTTNHYIIFSDSTGKKDSTLKN